MKKEYESPRLNLIEFEGENIASDITTSSIGFEEGGERESSVL